MKLDAKARKERARCPGRVLYRFTGTQVMKMIEAGIVSDDIELWDGVIYKMVKGELHNFLVARAASVLRDVMPPGYYVREEKSSKDGESSLPEPDVAVARGQLGDSLPDPPSLDRMALLIEVAHHTLAADAGEKLRRYAEVGVPVYWLIDVKAREVRVYERPGGKGAGIGYGQLTTYASGEDFAIVVDGQVLGRIAVDHLFPSRPTP